MVFIQPFLNNFCNNPYFSFLLDKNNRDKKEENNNTMKVWGWIVQKLFKMVIHISFLENNDKKENKSWNIFPNLNRERWESVHLKGFWNNIIMKGNMVSTIKAKVQSCSNQILHFNAFMNSNLHKSGYNTGNNNTHTKRR